MNASNDLKISFFILNFILKYYKIKRKLSAYDVGVACVREVYRVVVKIE